MKIRVIATALLCLVAGSVLAQAPSLTPRGPERYIERLTILLDLDAGQKVAVQKVLGEQREQMKALRQQAHSSDKPSEKRSTREEMQARHEQMHAQREQMKKDTQEKLRGILSDTQMKKFEVLTEHRPGFGPGVRGNRGDWHDDTAK